MSKPEYSSSRPSTSGTTTGEKPPNPKVSRTPESVRAVWDFIRPQPWVINNIRQRKSQMLLFRSWLAACAILILLLGTHSLKTIGNLCVRYTFSVRAHCADGVNTSVVLISGCFSPSSSLLVIRCKCTYSYVPSLKILQPLFNSLAITGCRSIADGTPGRLGHRVSRNEGSSRCAVSAYCRVDLGTGCQ